MFDLNAAIEKAVNAVTRDFSQVAPAMKALSALQNPDISPAMKKRLLVHLGVLTGRAFIGPQVLHLDIVGVCNLNCIFCRDHSPWVTDRETWRDMEMPVELIERLIDEAVEMGSTLVPFLGAGEPLMHSNFRRIIEKVKQAPLRFELFTNGLLFDRELLDLFLDADRGRIHFSISAASEKVYKRFRPDTPGRLYPKIEENISYLTQNRTGGLKVIVVQVLNNLNFHEVIPMAERAIALGVDEIQYKLTEYGDHGKSLMLTPEQLHSIELEMRHVKNIAGAAGLDIHDNIDLQFENYNLESGNYAEGIFDTLGCHIGWELVRIRRDGEISFCCGLKFMDHIGEKPLADYWYGPQMQKARLAGRGFPRGKNFTLPDGSQLRDKQCDYCYNYIYNFHARDELKELGLLEWVDRQR